MKRKRKKWIVFVTLMLFLFFIIAIIKEDSIVRRGTNDLIGIKNTSNIGQIEQNTVISQTFETADTFQGVAVLMGTFGKTQIGKIHVCIVNEETEEIVLDRQYHTFFIDNNKYFYFASDNEIRVDHPTTFQVIISESKRWFGPGVTIWCSTDDEYQQGRLIINEVEQKGDLCFGLVKNYREYMGWGLFIKRCMLIVIIATFLTLHCFIETKKIYNFIYDKRIYIALLLLLFFVVNKFHGSSINQYDNYIQQGMGSEYVTPVFGTSRSIRSDEWLVSVSRTLTAGYTQYGKVNDIVRATEASNLSASGLYRGYSALAKPANLGFYLLGNEYGMSFLWSFRMIFGFLFSFELCMIISENKKLLSFFGGTLIWFSSFNMWWSTVTWLIAGQAAVVFFYYFICEKNKWKRIFYGVGIALSAANFVVDLYPAWQVPAGYVYLILIIWIFWDNQLYWKSYQWDDWIIVAGCVAFMISIIVAYLYDSRDYIEAIMSTVYPGARVYYGGFSINKLLGYIATLLTPYMEYGNSSEIGCFFSFFPLSVVIFLHSFKRKKHGRLLMWLMLGEFCVLGLYCLIPLPEIVAKITLLTFSTPQRVADILGYLNVLMLIIGLSELENKKKIRAEIGVILSVVSTGVVLVYTWWGCDTREKKVCVLLIAIVTILAEISMISELKYLHEEKMKMLITITILIAGISVNPLMCGLDAIYSKPVAEKVTEIVKIEPEAKWIAVDSFVYPDYLIACGARTYNSTNYVPNLRFWEILDPKREQDEIYNRYAHIFISLTNEETTMELENVDYIHLNLNYNDLEKLDIDYVVSSSELECACKVGLNEICSEYGAYIYKMSEKNY